MKKCPQCNRTYPDDTLAFCLEDGALLSASYNPQETNAPTAAFNAFEAPTVVSTPPTVPSLSNPAQQAQTAGVGWKAYLLGLIISLVVDLTYSYGIYPLYAETAQELFFNVSAKFEEASVGMFAGYFLVYFPPILIYISLLSLILGLIWRRAKWRWGIIAVLPNLVITFYYMTKALLNEAGSLLYYIQIILMNVVLLIVACFFASIGSALSPRKSRH